VTTANFIAIVVGSESDPRRAELEAELSRRTLALADSGERLEVVDQRQVASLGTQVQGAAVVLCREGMSGAEIAAIGECQKRLIPIIPVVTKLADFNTVAPAEVASFNGFELADIQDIAELAGLVLEFLGLQRAKRKIFISYARRDASQVAQQLRDAFTARWYSVFLDTVSIRPGAAFQEELLQELADSDVVVLLNSPSVKDRPYVQQEIAFADQAGVGGVQVVWPEVAALREGGFFMPVPLDQQQAEIENASVKSLTPAGVLKILRRVADLRTALQQQREEQIVEPIRAYAQTKGWDAVPYLGRHIELRRGQDRIHLDVALGVPTSFDLERAFKAADPRPPAGRLVYDPLGITDRQAEHLDFLGSRLALQYLDPKAALQWTIIP
jgi:TIR domain